MSEWTFAIDGFKVFDLYVEKTVDFKKSKVKVEV